MDNNIKKLLSNALSNYNNKNFEAAISSYKSILKQNPTHLSALQNLAVSLTTTENFNAADIIYQKAIEIYPDNAALWSNYGNLLNKMSRYDEANQAHDKALTIAPNDAGFWYNAGTVAFFRSQPDIALNYYEQCLKHDPKHVKAQWNKAICHLHLGQYKEGFEHYETRLTLHPEVKHLRQGHYWQQQDLTNKTILLTTEQGFGDTIQFLRFILILKQKHHNLTVILECQAPLVKLFQQQEFIDAVIERGNKMVHFNYYYPLMSLAYALKPEPIDYLKQPAYLDVDLPQQWQFIQLISNLRRNKDFKVGYVWKSKAKPYDRSCPLFEIAKLAQQLPHIQFYSLQFGEDANEISDNHLDISLKPANNLGQYCQNFEDTAVLMKEMDLIISVDSAPAHLAGALGIPCWVLLLEYADWRWLLNTNESPWYQSIKLIRQKEQHQWQSVFEAVFSQLKAMSKDKK